MLRAAIIGAGTISPVHAEALRLAGARLVAIADVDRFRAEFVASKFCAEDVFDDWRYVVDRKDIDIIDVCTPPISHRDIVIAALSSGKHVICEKPLAVSVSDCDAIVECAKSASGKLLVVHQIRSHPFYKRLQWLIDQNILGEIHFARVQRYDPPPIHLVKTGSWGNWQISGGGILMTKAIHQMDMLLGLLGPVKRVQAMMGTFVSPIESEDHLTANLEFNCGALGNVALSGQPYGGYGQHFDLFGSRASVGQPWHIRHVNGQMNREILVELERRFPDPETGPTSGWRFFVRRIGWKFGRDFFVPRPMNSHLPLFLDFLSAIRHGNDPPVDGNAGRAAVELCTAIYQSALTGDSVQLPLDSSTRFYRGITKDDYQTKK